MIGSDLHKPNGLAVLRPEFIESKISHFPINKINGVGKVTKERLNNFGIFNFGDAQRFSKLDLVNMFGDFGASLYNYCRGIDNREVSTGGERKSLSVENTFLKDISKTEDLEIELRNTFSELQERLKKINDRYIKNIFIKIKYFDFDSTTIEAQMEPTIENFNTLFFKRFSERPSAVRLIGVGVKFFSKDNEGQLELPLI